MIDIGNLKKNLADYILLTFLIISFYLYLEANLLQGLGLYYIMLFVVFAGLKLSKEGFLRLFRLCPGGGWQKKNLVSFVMFILALVIISNILSFIIESRFLSPDYSVKVDFDWKYLYVFIIFNSVRTFGEELIFRGFLLIDYVRKNNTVFWGLNILQALLFSFIHSIIAEELISKLIFTAYVFLFSIFAGWVNRKYNSLLPSWLIHWFNGIINFFYVF